MDTASSGLVCDSEPAISVPMSLANRRPETADEVARAWLGLHGYGSGRYLASRRLVVGECYGWAWAQGLPNYTRHTLGKALAALLTLGGRETYLGNKALALACPPRPRPAGRNSKSGNRRQDPDWRSKALRLPQKRRNRRPPQWEHGGGI